MLNGTTNPCSNRGGNFGDNGGEYPAAQRGNGSTNFSIYNIGFRIALY